MPRVEPVLIFDLDGTILRRNSFPLFVLALLLGAPNLSLGTRVALSLATQRLLLARKLGRLGHDDFLRSLQDAWRGATQSGAALQDRLQARLLRLVRPNIVPVLGLVADDAMDSLLATAAAGEYAVPLGRALGFSTVLATPAGRTADEPSNSGSRKRDRVLSWLAERGWADKPRIFFNDDLADLPLMLECQAVCWFGGERALRKARAVAPHVRLVPCRNMRPHEMHATLAHLAQSLAAAQLATMASAGRGTFAGTSIVS